MKARGGREEGKRVLFRRPGFPWVRFRSMWVRRWLAQAQVKVFGVEELAEASSSRCSYSRFSSVCRRGPG